jgi:hypothetical protein
MVHLHSNERTSLRAAVGLLPRRDIEVLSLVHSGGRRLAFSVDGSNWTLDPNRCFTRAGVETDLATGNGRAPEAEVVEAVCRFGEALAAALGLDRGGPVVALHNNTNDGTFTVHCFEPGGELARWAAKVHASPDQAPDDFFLVTREEERSRLAEMGWNVVLQAPDPPDDGSLSVLCASRRLPYVNIEAQHAPRGREELNTLMILDALYVLEAATEERPATAGDLASKIG